MDITKLEKLSMLSIADGNLKNEESLEQELKEIIKNVALPETDEYKYEFSSENAMMMRPDVIVKSFSREEALLNAPQKQAGCFVVPKTVGEE